MKGNPTNILSDEDLDQVVGGAFCLFKAIEKILLADLNNLLKLLNGGTGTGTGTGTASGGTGGGGTTVGGQTGGGVVVSQPTAISRGVAA